MAKDEIEVIRGSGNVFADVGLSDPEYRHMKVMVAAAILKQQELLKYTVRKTAKLAKCDPADIQRIRNADIKRFTIDRLLKYAFRIGCKIEFKID